MEFAGNLGLFHFVGLFSLSVLLGKMVLSSSGKTHFNFDFAAICLFFLCFSAAGTTSPSLSETPLWSNGREFSVKISFWSRPNKFFQQFLIWFIKKMFGLPNCEVSVQIGRIIFFTIIINGYGEWLCQAFA